MLSKRLEGLSPYVAGEQPRDRSYIKLNTNENPYPPSPRVGEALRNTDPAILRLYSDPEARALREALALRYGVTPERVFAGNGSDEVLSFCFYAFFDGGGAPLLFPGPTYSFYPVYCGYYGIPYRVVPLRAGFVLCLDDYLSIPSAGVVFANPNAPTGIGISRAAIERFLESYPADRCVVVDEAYAEFGGETVIPLIAFHPNLVVVRTFSKSMSLAGMRIGYALGSPEAVSALTTVKDSFNSYPLDTIAQRAGIAALSDPAYYRETTKRIIGTRERVSKELRDLGFEVLPSLANFIFVRSPRVCGAEIQTALRERGILVRRFKTDGIEDYLRITIGTDKEMDILVRELARLR